MSVPIGNSGNSHLITIHMERKESGMNTVKSFIKAEEGRLSKVVEYGTGMKIELPINKDGSIQWYEDKIRQRDNLFH